MLSFKPGALVIESVFTELLGIVMLKGASLVVSHKQVVPKVPFDVIPWRTSLNKSKFKKKQNI